MANKNTLKDGQICSVHHMREALEKIIENEFENYGSLVKHSTVTKIAIEALNKSAECLGE